MMRPLKNDDGWFFPPADCQGERTPGTIVPAGLITISASTYLIIYSHYLYEKLSPWLKIFEGKTRRIRRCSMTA